MAYASTAGFRAVTNFKDSDITDTDVTTMITFADMAILRLATTEIYMEELEGDIDGVNVDFRVKHAPIADNDMDGDVDNSDVTVYYATFDDVTNFRELGTSKTVSSVSANDGIITMSVAPTTSTAEAGVFAVYRYFPSTVFNYDVLKLAANYYLAWLVANKIAGITPDLEMIQNPNIRAHKVRLLGCRTKFSL